MTREPSVFPVAPAETVPADHNPGVPDALSDLAKNQWRYDCYLCDWYVVVGGEQQRGISEGAARFIEQHHKINHEGA